MVFRKRYILSILISIWLLTLPFCLNTVAAKEFVVVIDPGHGGHDPGAVGKISREKNINLNVALKLGDLIKKNCDDVKVVYTRNRDAFISLDRRSEIANSAKADLFISIHTNALEKNRTMQGPSTWTLGLAKSEANFEVAKRENSVILYEDDYKSRYANFDPNSSESYIIFDFIQNKYMSQSVSFASLIQKHFKNTCRRIDRGVHQAGFLVLKASAMPSVLVELGFISTPEEERYLNTKEGVNSLANGIFQAFLQYKELHQSRFFLTGNELSAQIGSEENTDTKKAAAEEAGVDVIAENTDTSGNKPEVGKDSRANKPNVQPSAGSSTLRSSDETVFKVQILTSSSVLNKNDKRFKGLKNVDYYEERGLYKYTYGASADYNEIVRVRKSIQGSFKDAFIIALKNGKRVDVNAAIAEFKMKKDKK